MTFPAELKQARHAAGLTQKQLADEIDVSGQCVQSWEYGLSQPSRFVQACVLLFLESARGNCAKCAMCGHPLPGNNPRGMLTNHAEDD